LAKHDIQPDDIDAVCRVLESDRLSMGPQTETFEHAIAEYIGVRHAVAVNSGTSALHLIVRALGIGSGG
jgi:perosamine synthetase